MRHITSFSLVTLLFYLNKKNESMELNWFAHACGLPSNSGLVAVSNGTKLVEAENPSVETKVTCPECIMVMKKYGL